MIPGRVISWLTVLTCCACDGNVASRQATAADPNTKSLNDRNGVFGPIVLNPTPSTPTVPMGPISVRAYTNKVKNLLVGLAATEVEIQRVKQNPSELRELVAGWQRLPEYAPKMRAFLTNAFQQSQVITDDFARQGADIGNTYLTHFSSASLLSNIRESFARTVLYLDGQNQPLRDAMTTTTYMMTTPLAAFYCYLDQLGFDDEGNVLQQPVGAKLNLLLRDLTREDFATWRPVRVRLANPGEDTTGYSDLGELAKLNELVLKTPRLGFFTTPAFLATWQTNTSNQARVTVNQTMLTALGQGFDGTLQTMPVSLAALDTNHAAPNTACYACHLQLDPMRQIFRQTYSLYFSPQTDPQEKALPGMFAFAGVSRASPAGVSDLGAELSRHPLLPAAWVQKLCTYANDAPCLESDPEFGRVAQSFAGTMTLSSLVRELFASPLVTSSQAATVSSVAASYSTTKRDHLCALLSNRLGLNDVCGLAPGLELTGSAKTLQAVAQVLPSHGFGRGMRGPLLANDPTLFFRSSLESMCVVLADQVVDVGTLYSSQESARSIADMVHNFMGIDHASDAAPLEILQQHYQEAVSAGASTKDALKSTFVAACVSPAIAGMGQ